MDGYEAVRFRIGKWLEHDAVENREDSRHCGDSNGERRHRYRGEAWRAQESTCGKPKLRNRL
jgi:hypothetical protein